MSYLNAKQVLPKEILELLQNYIEGECIYIPRKEEAKKAWGSETATRAELSHRNACIFHDYLEGMVTLALAEKYFLSVKSIQRIVLNERKNMMYDEPESA